MNLQSSLRTPTSLIAICAGLAACGAEPAPGPAETVFTIASPTWFEETGGYYRVAATGQYAAYAARGRGRLVDLRASREDSAGWRGALEQVRAGEFDSRGGLVRLGSLQGRSAWFADSSAGPTALPVPAGSLPRWSRDGSAFAYFQAGDTTITIGPEGSGRMVRLNGAVTGLAWAPRGEALYAMVRQEDGLSTLTRIAPDGAIRVIRERLDAAPSFNTLPLSPDGRGVYLALASDSVPSLEARHDPQADRDLDIYRLELESGQLSGAAQGPLDDCCPAIADGYLYWTHNAPTAEIVVMPLAGGAQRVVAADGFLPRWRPDGRAIAFTRGYFKLADYGLDMDGWMVGVDSTGSATAPAEPFVIGYGEDMGPAWSPDGKWVAYHSHRSPGPVPLYDSPGRTDDLWLRLVADRSAPEIRLTDFGWEVGPPDWASDGRRMVFESWEKGGAPGVAKPWVATIDPGSGRVVSVNRLPLPPGVRGTAFEAWSPTSDQIALVERIDGARQALWITRPDGRGARRLVEFPSFTYGSVDWTPDGRELVYAGLAEGRMQIFAISPTGGESRQLTRGAVNLMHPQVSPDGRWLAASRIAWLKELKRIKLP